jgi:hypothetical protein
MMKGKAQWRMALTTLMACNWIGAAALCFVMLCWSAKSKLIEPWEYLLLAVGAAARCAALFPFGRDYITAVDAGHADWKYRFIWFVSCASIMGFTVALLLLPPETISHSIGLIVFVMGVLLTVPGEEKFAPRQQTLPLPLDAGREATA